MKFYYIWDAYCGWSYGFNQVLKDYLTKYPTTKLKMISGGLFLEEAAKPIGAYPHIPQANQKISQLYGVSFGDAYQNVLEEGELVMDSLYPATAFALMREKINPHQELDLALAIQEAFYQEGKDLQDLASYQALASQFQLQQELLTKELELAFTSHELGEADIEFSDLLGVTSYPTLIMEIDGKFAVLDTALPNLSSFEAEIKLKSAQLMEESGSDG